MSDPSSTLQTRRRGSSLAKCRMPKYERRNEERRAQRAGKGCLKEQQIGKRCLPRYTAALQRLFLLLPYIFAPGHKLGRIATFKFVPTSSSSGARASHAARPVTFCRHCSGTILSEKCSQVLGASSPHGRAWSPASKFCRCLWRLCSPSSAMQSASETWNSRPECIWPFTACCERGNC